MQHLTMDKLSGDSYDIDSVAILLRSIRKLETQQGIESPDSYSARSETYIVKVVLVKVSQ